MEQKRFAARPLLAALLVSAAQLFVAVVLIAPQGALSWRYITLIQHDSYWFANIVERGYDTTVPPISHKMMEVSNVAFFPAYPALAAALKYGLHFSTSHALLVTAQSAAFGFWSYFFLFCERWNISPLLQFFGATAVAAHPAAFFLIAAYSESLFMMSLLGFLFWSTSNGRGARLLAIVHGIFMSATRIVGIPCALFPLVVAFLRDGRAGMRGVRSWLGVERGAARSSGANDSPVTRTERRPAGSAAPRYGTAVLMMLGAMSGALGFFFYCLVKWGRWDIYMLTQEAGWAIAPDYLAIFKPGNWYWHLPALNDPVTMSQMVTTFGLILFVLIALCELLPIVRRDFSSPLRLGLYFTAFIVFYISASGVASVAMESMLRYQFCAHALIVLALLQFLHQLPTPRPPVRVLGMAATALFSAAGFALQGWYVWNFTRGGWVA